MPHTLAKGALYHIMAYRIVLLRQGFLAICEQAAILTLLLSAVAFGQGFDLSPEVAELIRAGEYRAAEQLVLASDAFNPNVVAWLKAKQGDVNAAIDFYNRSAPANPDKGTVERRAVEVAQIIADSSIPAAIKFLRERCLDESLADSESLWLQLLVLYARSPNPQDGQDIAAKVLAMATEPDALRTPLYEYCVALYTRGFPQIALNLYVELSRRVPEVRIAPGYQLQFAHLSTAAGRPLDSLAILDALRSEFPDYSNDNEALLLVAGGLAYEKLGDEHRAAEQFEKLVGSDHVGGRSSGLITMAKDKLRNFSENQQARRLVDDSEDIPSRPLVTKSTGGPTYWMWLHILTVVAIVLYLIGRRVWRTANV